MITGLDLNIFWHKDNSTYEAQEMGLEVDLKDCILKPHTFYTIDWIRPQEENYCTVCSSGYTFIVNEKYEVVKKKIEELRVLRFN